MLAGLASRLAGSTGADAERLVRCGRARARRAGRSVTLDDLLEEAGADDTRTPEQLWRSAVHEAGHALALCELAPGTLETVSVRASDGQGGATVSAGPGGPVLPGDIHRQLACMLAGRAAEQSVFGQPSSGAGGGPGCDLAQATLLAATSASAMGFAACAGLAWSGVPTAATLPGMLAGSAILRAEVGRVLDEAYASATELVSGRKRDLLAIAAALAERGALDADGVIAAVDAAAQETRR